MSDKLISAILFTGLPCSGKTTLACLLQEELIKTGLDPIRLDGDIFRNTTGNNDFTMSGRWANMSNIAYYILRNIIPGDIVIGSFIAPLQKMREYIRKALAETCQVKWIWVDTPWNWCVKRDAKGMYKKALAGDIKSFTGVDSLYEYAWDADIILDGTKPIEEQLQFILDEIGCKK